ncbi:hypothetical protein ACJMK2_008659 [Sinanodonta woodiana]|uniref:Cytochrome P450 n=1 Tax=Sinanodonta woodiana TaxID=1069815 RepID=A0ABD3VNK4_SINWO
MYTTFFGFILSTFLGLLIVCLFAILVLKRRNTGRKLPGPAWVPLVGNRRELKSDPDMRVSLRRLQDKYGDIYQLYLGPIPVIVVCGYEAIREMFIKRGIEFSDRPAASLPIILLTGGKGVSFTSGDAWKNQKKFVLETLRNFGFGKSTLEYKIHMEVNLFLSEIAKQNQAPFRMMSIIATSVGNVISHLVFGGHFSYEDARFKTMADAFSSFMRFISIGSPVLFLPILRFIPGDLFGIKIITRKLQVVRGFVNELIDEHIQKFDEENIEDFIDAFISEMKKVDKRDSKSIFTREYLVAIVMDLFLAGTETTSTTFTWASFYLASRPDIQNRIFEEINENIGTEKLPSIQDKKNLVYTEAFIMEVLRISSTVILSVAHAPVTDVCIRGYRIPKGIRILPDIHSVLSDPKVWGDPENFRPERFVNEDGKLIKPDEFIPFFTGKRKCLGASMAQMELFLFISALVQRFELKPPEGKTLDIKDVDGVCGGTHSPKPFYIRAIPRRVQA